MAMGAPSELVGAEGVRPTEPVISVPRAEQLQDCSLRSALLWEYRGGCGCLRARRECFVIQLGCCDPQNGRDFR